MGSRAHQSEGNEMADEHPRKGASTPFSGPKHFCGILDAPSEDHTEVGNAKTNTFG